VVAIPQAQDGGHFLLEDSLDLGIDHLVGLAKHLTSLGVTNDDKLDVELGQHLWGHLAGERALGLKVAVLCAQQDGEAVSIQNGLNGPDIGERRMHRHIDGLVVVLVNLIRQRLDKLNRLKVIEVHLPVATDERLTPLLCH